MKTLDSLGKGRRDCLPTNMMEAWTDVLCLYHHHYEGANEKGPGFDIDHNDFVTVLGVLWVKDPEPGRLSSNIEEPLPPKQRKAAGHLTTNLGAANLSLRKCAALEFATSSSTYADLTTTTTCTVGVSKFPCGDKWQPDPIPPLF